MSQKIDVSIISSGANIADARLHRLTNALLRHGLVVELFAPGNPADAPALTPEALSATADAQALTTGTHSLTADAPSLHTSSLIIRPCTNPLTRGTGMLPRYLRSRTFGIRARGKVLYALSPESFLPTLSWISFTNIVKSKSAQRVVAVDLYEDYLRVLKDRAWAKKYFGILGAIAKSDTKAALWAAQRAALTTVADTQVPPFHAKQRLVVRNLPDHSMLTQSGVRDAQPRAIYIGDLRTSRGLRTMLDAAKLSPDWRFDFVGAIAPADQSYVQSWLVENPESASRITFHGKLAPRDAWRVARGAWVGLSLLEPTPAFIEAVPSKLYEYMAVGLATISSPLPRCVELIGKSGSGAIAAGPEAVSAQLRAWQSKPRDLDQIRANAHAWAAANLDSNAEYDRLAQAIAHLR